MVPVTLLDTSALPPQERDVATREFFGTVAELDVMEHACPPESIRTRVRALGLDKFQLHVTDGPWLHFGLDQPATTEAVSIAAQVSGQTVTSDGERRRAFAPGEIILTDCSSPFQWWAGEASTTMWCQFSHAELCLPAAAIRPAA